MEADGRCMASSINNDGATVGYWQNDQRTSSKPFLWDKTGVKTLDTGTYGNGGASSINEMGVVAGTLGRLSSDDRVAAIWRDGKPIVLGTLPGAKSSMAFSINDKDVVVGESDGLPFTWKDGTLAAWGEKDAFNAIRPLHINTDGDVVAYSTKGKGGFVWRNGTLAQLMNPLSTYSYVMPSHISDNGTIVGWAKGRSKYGNSACIWQRDGQGVDLNSLTQLADDEHLLVATARNRHGLICGCGFQKGKPMGFILYPLTAGESDTE
ncbi:MAG: hypothetical protein KDA38_10965 [Planctomycetales bacterium]|nr:hypothetical protein [Planctomycetales bacterium]